MGGKINKSGYDEHMDLECVELCDAINLIPGLQTVESCCGHGERPFVVFFDVADLTYLPLVLFFCSPSRGVKWQCLATTDGALSPVSFHIESKAVGEQAYKEAEYFAKKIKEYIDEDVLSDLKKQKR